MISQRPSRISATPGTMAIACGILAVIAIIWAVVNQTLIADLQSDINGLREDNTILRENANSTAYVFERTEISPASIGGVAYIGTSGSGVVAVSNLPPAGDDEVFQLWLINPDDSVSGAGTLLVADNNQGFALIPADATGYDRIAVSLEPNGGSNTPSGGYLLVAEVNAGRGWQPQPMAARRVCQNHSKTAVACTWINQSRT